MHQSARLLGGQIGEESIGQDLALIRGKTPHRPTQKITLVGAGHVGFRGGVSADANDRVEV